MGRLEQLRGKLIRELPDTFFAYPVEMILNERPFLELAMGDIVIWDNGLNWTLQTETIVHGTRVDLHLPFNTEGLITYLKAYFSEDCISAYSTVAA